MLVHPMELEVVGWGAAHAAARADVVHYGFLQRLERAVGAVALVWIVAFPFLFVPWLFILVIPSAIALSVFFFVVRMRATDVARVCQGTCPDCGTIQSFDVPVRFKLPVAVECVRCSRELTLERHPAVG